MAKIDLKKATIRIKDGFNDPGAVNHTGGYSAGVTTMAVDGFTHELFNGQEFLITGQTTVYTITSHSPGSGATTSITFTPALTASVLDNAVITPGPRQLDVKIGDGNFQYTEKRNMEYIKDRGFLDTVREGDEEPVEVSFDFTWEYLTANTGGTPTVEDVLKKIGEASDWETSSSDACEPYAVDIEIDYDPECGTNNTEVTTLSDFRWEQFQHDLKNGTVAVTGKCNITRATSVRS